MSANTRETLLEILKNLHPNIDFESEDKLITNKVLDSFDIVTLVTDLGEEFDVDIDSDDLIPENFNSVDAMAALIDSKLD
ncbi:acyl carrier protein [Lactimicrobium massiliense]|uniref:acyl carrier protein n=1 Tax=Lactimicrobium massiliense TaxID=2161814 RepID=UPI000D54AF64|nr:acyl carrier protein [Lactimicrobium massiliense]